MTTELKPIYDSRKSFYGRAIVESDKNIVKLLSYGTHVATVVRESNDPNNIEGRNVAIVKGYYSQTTLRHVKEFLKQNGFKAESKKQIAADYMGSN